MFADIDEIKRETAEMLSLQMLQAMQEQDETGVFVAEEIRRYIEFEYTGDRAVLRDW